MCWFFLMSKPLTTCLSDQYLSLSGKKPLKTSRYEYFPKPFLLIFTLPYSDLLCSPFFSHKVKCLASLGPLVYPLVLFLCLGLSLKYDKIIAKCFKKNPAKVLKKLADAIWRLLLQVELYELNEYNSCYCFSCLFTMKWKGQNEITALVVQGILS